MAKKEYHRKKGAHIIEVLKDKHKIHNKVQHPLGNKKGVGLTPEQRADWDKVRYGLQKERAKVELIKRGLFKK